MLSTSRFESRKRVLEDVTDLSRMKSVWKSTVRSALRDQPLPDLHDHYDFHTNLTSRLEVVRDSILDGLYTPQIPFRVTLEKNKGICRQIPLIGPQDSVVIESLGAYLLPSIIRHSPSKRAYYSRRSRKPKSIDDFSGDPDYPWWILWPQFQQEIFNFSKSSPFTVVADVATYYDNIDFRQLRNYLAHLIRNSEPLLDFLFYLLERFSWRPDYLPHPQRGLPQSDIDCVRLLAHAFLFEIDGYLKKEKRDQFVRWMDDIDFAAEDVREAHRHLKSINELLQSRGLHLNSSKCQVLSSKEAHDYFHIDTNLYLSVLERGIQQGKAKGRLLRRHRSSLRQRFKLFEKNKNHGHGNKVFKRFLNIAAGIQDDSFSAVAIDSIASEPTLRDTVFRYFSSIGWNRQAEDSITEFVKFTVDDVALFQAIRLLIHWDPQKRVAYIERMRQLSTSLSQKGPVGFLAAVWLSVKYANDAQISYLILNNTRLWSRNAWLGRQIACALPRCNDKTQFSVLNAIHSFGLKDAKLVLDSYNTLSSAQYERQYQFRIQSYLLATKKNNVYPVPKFLLSLALMKGKYSIGLKDQIYHDLMQVVEDPIFRLRITQALYP